MESFERTTNKNLGSWTARPVWISEEWSLTDRKQGVHLPISKFIVNSITSVSSRFLQIFRFKILTLPIRQQTWSYLMLKSAIISSWYSYQINLRSTFKFLLSARLECVMYCSTICALLSWSSRSCVLVRFWTYQEWVVCLLAQWSLLS